MKFTCLEDNAFCFPSNDIVKEKISKNVWKYLKSNFVFVIKLEKTPLYLLMYFQPSCHWQDVIQGQFLSTTGLDIEFCFL